MMMWTLYCKEMRERKNSFGLLVAAALLLGIYALGQEGNAKIWAAGLTMLPYGAVLVLPFMLAQSFGNETKAQTHYQLLALPVPRWQIGLSKVAAVWTAGMGVFALATGAFHANALQLGDEGMLHGLKLQGIDIWLLGGLGFYSPLLLFMGMACVMEGIRQAVKRYKGMVSLAVFIGCLWLYADLAGPATAVLSGLGEYTLDLEIWRGAEQVEVDVGRLLYTGIYGLCLVGLGLFLYDRYAEVE